MITLYVNPLSTPALSVMFAANILEVSHELKIIDLMNGEHMSPEFKAINPFCKVPALKDGDFTLAESGAIVKYLARKVKSPLYPSEHKARAVTEQWYDFGVVHIRTPFSRVMFNRLFAEKFGQKKDEASIALGLRSLSTMLPYIEEQLSKSDFITGEVISLADIALLATLDPSEAVGVDLSPYIALSKWRANLRAEPFYTKVHSHYGAEIGL